MGFHFYQTIKNTLFQFYTNLFVHQYWAAVSLKRTNISSIFFPPPRLQMLSQQTHPLSHSCCHGNHHRVANGESQKEVQVRIHLPAAASALCSADLPDQVLIWNDFSFLLEKKDAKCVSIKPCFTHTEKFFLEKDLWF